MVVGWHELLDWVCSNHFTLLILPSLSLQPNFPIIMGVVFDLSIHNRYGGGGIFQGYGLTKDERSWGKK